MPVTYEKQTPNKPEVGENDEEKKSLRERSPLLWLFIGGVVGALGFYLVKRVLEGPIGEQEALPPAAPPQGGYPPPPQYYYPPPPPHYPPWWRG